MATSRKNNNPIAAPHGLTDASEPADKRQQRAEHILDVAAVLLVRWGFRKTTIDDVAREAGVGKGTIYLHWKDKNELFLAAIWRASRQVTAETLQRLAADPEGGHFHRFWAHGMVAIYANPLLAALMQGNADIFQGLIDSLSPATTRLIIGNTETHIIQLQEAGLIRKDLTVQSITFLMSTLKVGMISAAELLGPDHTPSAEALTDAISDLIRRWLEPEHPPEDSSAGKRIMAEWMELIYALSTWPPHTSDQEEPAAWPSSTSPD